MKPLEDAFSSAGFRRVVLPGVVLTIGIHPLLSKNAKLTLTTYGVTESAVVLIVEVIFFGLLVSSGINWVYYVYEGYKLPWLTAIAGRWNRRHLASVQAEYDGILNGRSYAAIIDDFQKARAALVYEKLLDYPLELRSTTPTRVCSRPTVLGNIIAAYEGYAMSRYHVDGVYYWFHFLALAPERATKEFSENYAFAESLVLTSFAGAIVAIVNLGLLSGFALAAMLPCVPALTIPVTANTATTLAAVGILVFTIFYGLALPAHREVGRVFQAVVDLTIKDLDKWSAETHAPLESTSEDRIKNRKRYLNSLR